MVSPQSIKQLDKEVNPRKSRKSVGDSEAFKRKCEGTITIICKLINKVYCILIFYTAIMDGGDTEKKEGGEEEALRKELRLARKRIAELEVENEDLKQKLLKLDK